MTAKCKVDYGQFEINKKYEYYLQNQRYYVNGEYSKSEFTKRQFDSMFIPDNQNKTNNYIKYRN
jgi:hypothetical protein